jgi:hypothetical protein
MIKTGNCQRQFRQTNKHQHYLNKKLNSELHGEVEFTQTSKKNTFIPPSRNEISSLTLGSRLSCLLSVNMMYRVLLLQYGKTFCLTVNTRTNVCKIYKTNLDNKPFTISLYNISFWQNNKKMGHLEIFCFCFLYCQGLLHSRGPMTE